MGGFRTEVGWAAVVEDEVVALAVSPGLGDGEAALGGLVEKGGFGALSGALGVGTAGRVRRVGRGVGLAGRGFGGTLAASGGVSLAFGHGYGGFPK